MDTPSTPKEPTPREVGANLKRKSRFVSWVDHLGLRRLRIILTRKFRIIFRRAQGRALYVKKMAVPLTHHPYARWVLLVCIILILFFVYRFVKFYNAKKANAPRPVPVVVAEVKRADVPIYIPTLGTVTPNRNITVRTQINGQLLRVLFTEGQMVKAGDLLAEIDPRPYQAQLLQYEGQLARDQALLANARIDLNRYETLFKQDSVSEQTLATQRSLVQQLEGTVKFDEGQIEGVKVNLIYTQITSPVDGRVGLRLVDPGNFVQTTDTTGLFVLNTVQPISVIFSIPEDNLPQVMQQVIKGNTLPVEAYDRTNKNLLAIGALSTMDNQIDTTTGTIKIRSEFNNENGMLFPNQFVNVKLQVDILKQSLVVPTPAVQNGVNGTFVFVVNEDKTVSIKPVTVRTALDNTTAISADLVPGQSVVVIGTEKLIEGSKVLIQPEQSNGQNNTTRALNL